MQRTYRVLPTTSTEVCKGINTNKQTPNKLTNERGEYNGSDKTDTDTRLKFPMPLPTFSESVQSSLQNGDLWYNEPFKSQFICELAIFYRIKNINVCKSYKDSL